MQGRFRQGMFMVLVGAMLWGWAGCANDSEEEPSGSNEALVPVAVTENTAVFEGDSIFHETMVDMTWPEVEKAAEDGAIVLFNTAVIEEHGPHMSCGIDSYLGYNTCKMVRRDLESRGIKTLIAPPFYWGINNTTHVFGGTFTVKPETMKAVLLDTFESLKNMGFTNVFNINSHGDGMHISTTITTIIEARQSLGMNIRYMLSEDDLGRYGLTGEEGFILTFDSPGLDLTSMEYLDIHAGANETGAVAAYFPEQVDKERALTLIRTKLGIADVAGWIQDARRVTPGGYLGDPASFDAAEGKKLWGDESKKMAEAIEKHLKEK
ncbi:MAG: creatininase family protein [Planctomycetes bacterium]|nr:creatininase family protein [Planctomycetota bacterium]